MADLPKLELAGARNLCAGNYDNGLKYFRSGALSSTWRTSSTLYASVAGSAKTPYEVSLEARDDGSLAARCTCPAARRQQLCKHAAAVLVAWAEHPERFTLRAMPEVEKEARGGLKVESEAKRLRQPKQDRRALIVAGLEKAESLLIDLCAQGLLAVTPEQVEMIGSLAKTLEAHKLRRLARQVAQIRPLADAARRGDRDFDERVWARLLADTWFVLSATRKTLEGEGDADQAELEELVGKTWLEKDLRRVENMRLLELAYETDLRAAGFRVDVSYLLDLEDGALYAEKQITPLHLKDVPKKRSYSLPLRVAAAGVYPGFAPYRLKLLAVEEDHSGGDEWDRALALAETSAAALRQRLSQATASPVAPQEVYSLFRPAAVLVDGGSLHLVDAEKRALRLGAENASAAYGLREALRRGPVEAVFCRARFGDDALLVDPLSAILKEGPGRQRAYRGDVSPIGASAGARLVRLSA